MGYHQRTAPKYGLCLRTEPGRKRRTPECPASRTQCSKERCEIAISIDADLQDDIQVIPDMINSYKAGNDIVYGVRKERKTDTFFKRNTALVFYRLMKAMGVKSVYNHADYRLMSQRAIQHLCRFRERNLFLRGLVPLIGYQTDSVYYNRDKRFAGESKYPSGRCLILPSTVSLPFPSNRSV